MKEFLEKNQTTWEWNMEHIPASSFHNNIFCFGSDKSKNLAIAKKAAKSAIGNCVPCVIVTRNPEAWHDIEEEAKANEYIIKHDSNAEHIARTEIEARDKEVDISEQAFDFVRLAICSEPFLLILKAPAQSDGIQGGFTLLDALLDVIGEWDEDISLVHVIIDDADGRTGLFIPTQVFPINLSYCITMGDQITNRDWREDIQDVTCEAYIAPKSPALYDTVFDEDADASYERFFNLFPIIISTGVRKDVVSQLQFFMFHCLTMLPSKKRNLALPFMAFRDNEYAEDRFEKIAKFYEKNWLDAELEEDWDD